MGQYDLHDGPFSDSESESMRIPDSTTSPKILLLGFPQRSAGSHGFGSYCCRATRCAATHRKQWQVSQVSHS